MSQCRMPLYHFSHPDGDSISRICSNWQPDFVFKMHQIKFRMRCPQLYPAAGRSSRRSPDHLVARGRDTLSPSYFNFCYTFLLRTIFPVNSCIHVECSASFCPFFHIGVTVQKSTQDRTIRAFIPAILLNLSLLDCDSTFLFRL